MDLQKITTGVTAAAVVGTGATVGVQHQLDKMQGGPEKRIEAERNELRIIIPKIIPKKPDIAVINIDSVKIILIISMGSAPNAFLIPSSLVLSFTINTIMLDIPIIPAINVPIPTKVTIICNAFANCIDLSISSATFLTLIPLGSVGSIDFLFLRNDLILSDNFTAPEPPIL